MVSTATALVPVLKTHGADAVRDVLTHAHTTATTTGTKLTTTTTTTVKRALRARGFTTEPADTTPSAHRMTRTAPRPTGSLPPAPAPSRPLGAEQELAGHRLEPAAMIRFMAILDILTEVAKTGRWGPVVTGADWNEVTAAFGEPWDVGTMSRSRKWPRLFAYGDLELSVCRCRRIGLICIQTWRDVIELPSSTSGAMQNSPGGVTCQDVTQALDQAGCPWQPDVSFTFGGQCALTALPSGATFTFEIARGTEPTLNVVGLPGDSHHCPAPTRRTTP
ncbi:hypothetical protein ACIRQY_34020 [Streptomyces sp. NPDC101490]|uniref:hypothetical protein n=1 Tax=Streptomyces sp. NPDC101490 TaxID=3366143 RepID=UPI0037FFE574